MPRKKIYSPLIGVRVGEETDKEINAFMKKHRIKNKTDAVRKLIQMGLDTQETEGEGPGLGTTFHRILDAFIESENIDNETKSELRRIKKDIKRE